MSHTAGKPNMADTKITFKSAHYVLLYILNDILNNVGKSVRLTHIQDKSIRIRCIFEQN